MGGTFLLMDTICISVQFCVGIGLLPVTAAIRMLRLFTEQVIWGQNGRDRGGKAQQNVSRGSEVTGSQGDAPTFI